MCGTPFFFGGGTKKNYCFIPHWHWVVAPLVEATIWCWVGEEPGFKYGRRDDDRRWMAGVHMRTGVEHGGKRMNALPIALTIRHQEGETKHLLGNILYYHWASPTTDSSVCFVCYVWVVKSTLEVERCKGCESCNLLKLPSPPYRAASDWSSQLHLCEKKVVAEMKEVRSFWRECDHTSNISIRCN